MLVCAEPNLLLDFHVSSWENNQSQKGPGSGFKGIIWKAFTLKGPSGPEISDRYRGRHLPVPLDASFHLKTPVWFLLLINRNRGTQCPRARPCCKRHFVFVGVQGFRIKAAELLKLIQFSFIYFVSSYLSKIYFGRHRSTQPFTNQSSLWSPADLARARQWPSASSGAHPAGRNMPCTTDLCSHVITVSKI